MNNGERLTELEAYPAIQGFSDSPRPIEAIQNMSEEVIEYLLSWDNQKQQALICGRTGSILVYYRLKNGIAEEYRGAELEQFKDEIDSCLIELLLKYTDKKS